MISKALYYLQGQPFPLQSILDIPLHHCIDMFNAVPPLNIGHGTSMILNI